MIVYILLKPRTKNELLSLDGASVSAIFIVYRKIVNHRFILVHYVLKIINDSIKGSQLFDSNICNVYKT